MKIVYAAPMRLPTEKAHGIQIMETCAALARVGDSVELLVTRLKETDPFSYYDIPSGLFRIKKVMSPDTVQFGPIGFFLHSIIFAFGAVQFARRSRADVFYTRDPLCMLVAIFVLRIPTVWEVHSGHARVPGWILRRLAGVVAITKGLADFFCQRGIPARHIVLAPDAVALDKFAGAAAGKTKADLRRRFNIPTDRPVALYMGSFNIYAWKGLDVVLASAHLVPEVTWVIAGGSEEECDEIKKTASDNVVALDRVGRRDVPFLLATADVLLLPNKKGDIASERDTSPMKLFEYMAMNIPIVASDLPSLREVLSEDNAFFAEPNSATALVAAVRSVLAETGEAQKTANNARQEVEKYTWDTRAETIRDFLRSIAPASA